MKATNVEIRERFPSVISWGYNVSCDKGGKHQPSVYHNKAEPSNNSYDLWEKDGRVLGRETGTHLCAVNNKPAADMALRYLATREAERISGESGVKIQGIRVLRGV